MILRPRAVLSLVAVLLAVAAALEVVLVARTVIIWILISLFLAVAIDPAVQRLQRTRIRRRGAAVAIVYLAALLLVAAIAAVIIPTLARQVDDFIKAVPGYVNDLTQGRGPLGFLERKYNVVEKVQQAVGNGGSGKLLSHAGVLISVGKGVASFVAGLVTIILLTLFMLLEGPQWVERGYHALPEASHARWRDVGHEIYRTVSGYVTGNLVISAICGAVYGIALAILGVPYALALGFIAAVLDLIPLAGATVGGLIVVGVAFADSVTAGIVMAVIVVAYQQLENHVLQPVVYGRTVDLSPLAVLIAVLIGAQVAGVLGALGAIPIAGTLQVLLRSAINERRSRTSAPAAA
ncbi:MAG: AI-2E family transporter [Solirubrobacteraceae bacterium]